MKSRIWRLAGVGLLCLSVSAQTLAENNQQEQRGGEHGARDQHGGGERGGERGGQPQNRAPQEQNHGQPNGGQWQGRGNEHQNERAQPSNFQQGHEQQNREQQNRAQPNQFQQNQNRQPEHNNPPPIQARPDTVRQTQQPIHGNYQDLRQNGERNWQGGDRNGERNWQGGDRNGGHNWQAGGRREEHRDDRRWPGRPDGHGNGWGSGPQYRPGHMIDRFPEQNYRVPYRGRDFFFSGGYWYRPMGSRYQVVTPPYGIRTRYIPDYAREVWIGGALLFLAAGSYYQWLDNSQEYVVVSPPQEVQVQQQPASPYDVASYPVYGQSPEQVQQDRYDCYRWAVEQTRFDPAAATYAPDASVVASFRNATASCLSGRGYQVN